MTENEAIHLINLLKEILNNKKVYIPLNGEKSNTIVVDIKDQIPFNIIIYRGRREKNKMSISALTKSRETLLRLDVFGPEHTNPDGTIISGNHLHIFKDKLEMKEAIEFNINDKNLIDITLDFLNKFNVINPKVERKELEVN